VTSAIAQPSYNSQDPHEKPWLLLYAPCCGALLIAIIPDSWALALVLAMVSLSKCVPS
jgi:hypothetical protein